MLKAVQNWLANLIDKYSDVFPTPPRMEFARRWMYPSQTEVSHASVLALQESVQHTTGKLPVVMGAPYACDMWALHRLFDMPGIVFGPTGANSHAADEYVEMESVFQFVEALLRFTLNWCGVVGV